MQDLLHEGLAGVFQQASGEGDTTQKGIEDEVSCMRVGFWVFLFLFVEFLYCLKSILLLGGLNHPRAVWLESGS